MADQPVMMRRAETATQPFRRRVQQVPGARHVTKVTAGDREIRRAGERVRVLRAEDLARIRPDSRAIAEPVFSPMAPSARVEHADHARLCGSA